MCGITGLVSRSGTSVNQELLKEANRLIAHRGPDDEGEFLDGALGLGHRRLSIVDLSKDGRQPMSYAGRYVITYNGEIYNYVEIKSLLLDEGYVFRTNTDTEVILASFDFWGESCVEKFNGMWAFAIFDRQENTIFCSRDRFGIKPFYFTETENYFAFGSEIKQLLLFQEENFVNKKILIDYLVIGLEEHTNETFFENIFKLEQAHNLVYDLKSHTYEIKKYYYLEASVNSKAASSSESYFELFERSVRLRLRSDVKVGTCLSGGLDSSIVAAVASKFNSNLKSEKFLAIHGKSTQKSSDESQFAQEVAQHCDIDLHIIEPSESELMDVLDEVVFTQEEPFGGLSVFMQYFVMKKARELGCIVLLDGQGGDETLLGYERYYPAYLFQKNPFGMIKSFLSASRNSKLSLLTLAKYVVYFSFSKVRYSSLIMKNQFVKDDYLVLASKPVLEESAKNFLNVRALQIQELKSTQLPHLLKYEDKNSMKNSIETRLPFIDFNVAEAAISLDSEQKIQKGWTKANIRRSAEGLLPSSILWRKNKFGFEAPSQDWTKALEAAMKKEISESRILSIICEEIKFDELNQKQRWKLFNIAKWEKIYNVRIE